MRDVDMTRDEAEKLSLALLKTVGLLDETAAYVKDHDDKANWDKYRHAVGRAMATVSLDLAEPIWVRFPELRPVQLGGSYEVDPGIYQPLFYDPE